MATNDYNSIVPEQAKKDLIDINNLLELSVDHVVKLVQESRKIDLGGVGNVKSFSDHTKAMNNANAANARLVETSRMYVEVVEDQTDAQKKLENAQKRLQIAQSQESKEITATTEKIKVLNKEQRERERLEKSEIGSLNHLKAQLAITRLEYDKLGAHVRENTVEGKAMELHIQRLTNELKRLEGNIGVHGRKVGDYTRHWNGLDHSIAQMAREMPAYANSVSTGILAMSNNFPILLDEIKKTRVEIARLKALGQSYVPLWKQVAKSFLSWQNILMIGVTLLITYSRELFNTKEETKDLADETDKLTNSLKGLAEEQNKAAMNTAKTLSIGSDELKRQLELAKAKGASDAEIAMLSKKYNKERIAELNDEKQSYLEAERAVLNYAGTVLDRNKEMRNALFDTDKSMSDVMSSETEYFRQRNVAENTMIKTLKENYGISTKQAKDYAKQIVESTDRIAATGKTREELTIKDYGFLQEFTNKKTELEEKTKDISNQILIDEAEARRRSYDKRLKDAEEFYKRLRDKEKSIDTQILPNSSAIRRQIKALENEGLAKEYNDALFKVDSYESDNLTQLNQQYQAGKITAERYETELTRIKADAEADRLRLELEYTRKILLSGEQEYEEQKKLALRIKEIETELTRQGIDEKLKAEREYTAESIRIEQQRAQRIKDLRIQLADATVELGNILISKQREELREQESKLEREKDLEIAKIEATAKTEEEMASRKYAVELKMLERKESIKKREEQLEKTKFRLEKAAALARILINTQESVAKIQAQAAVLQASTVTAPLAAAALAQIPFVYGSAAISAGLIGAQILAYKDGTDYHPYDGPAILGDGGEHELIGTPDGKYYLSPDTPTVMDLPMGANVTPVSDILADSNHLLLPHLMNAAMLHSGGDTRKMERIMKKGLDKVEQAINSKPVSSVYIHNGQIYQTTRTANTVTKTLSNNISG